MVLFPRWLTTAARILRLFISKHELSNQSRKILRLLAQYICSAYGTVWYRIKQDPHWNNGPLHLLSHIKAIKQLPKEIQDIAFKVVEIGFYYGHSESILQTMLSSPDQEDRIFARKQIEAIRSKSSTPDIGNNLPRDRTLPKNIDFSKVETLRDMLYLNKEILEPPNTCMIKTAELVQFDEKPMEVKDWICHTQPVERAIRLGLKWEYFAKI